MTSEGNWLHLILVRGFTLFRFLFVNNFENHVIFSHRGKIILKICKALYLHPTHHCRHTVHLPSGLELISGPQTVICLTWKSLFSHAYSFLSAAQISGCLLLPLGPQLQKHRGRSQNHFTEALCHRNAQFGCQLKSSGLDE